MLRNINISIGPECYATERKTTRHITITVKADNYPDFQKTEIVEENDFHSNFSVFMEKAKKEFLKEYKSKKKGDNK